MIIAALVVSLGLNLFLLMAWHIARRALAAAQAAGTGTQADAVAAQRLRKANAELLARVAELDAEVKQHRSGEP